MTEIQQNRWDQLIRRAANIVGGGSQVNDTLNELFPTIDVERVPGELLFLSGWLLGLGSSTLSAAAGETSKMQLFNPVGSGKICTVTRAIISVTGTQRVRWSVNTAVLATGIATGLVRDLRAGDSQLTTCQFFQESSVGLVNANGQADILASDPLDLRDENGLAILPPGFGFTVGASLLASRLTVTFNWRERVAEPAELNF